VPVLELRSKGRHTFSRRRLNKRRNRRRNGSPMATPLPLAVRQYLSSGKPAQGTRNEYATTLKKWAEWGKGGPIEQLSRREVREFLDWVYERPVEQSGTNPGRTSNKAREHLRAVISWAWEQDLIEAPPRFPKPRYQRDVAGRHYLTKAELNAIYFATYQMRRPRGWSGAAPVGRQWRSALVLFFNYGFDTGTIWKTVSWHEPLLWRPVFWSSQSPDPDVKAPSIGLAVLPASQNWKVLLSANEPSSPCTSTCAASGQNRAG
jgi:hypothetical protein